MWTNLLLFGPREQPLQDHLPAQFPIPEPREDLQYVGFQEGTVGFVHAGETEGEGIVGPFFRLRGGRGRGRGGNRFGGGIVPTVRIVVVIVRCTVIVIIRPRHRVRGFEPSEELFGKRQRLDAILFQPCQPSFYKPPRYGQRMTFPGFRRERVGVRVRVGRRELEKGEEDGLEDGRVELRGIVTGIGSSAWRAGFGRVGGDDLVEYVLQVKAPGPCRIKSRR